MRTLTKKNQTTISVTGETKKLLEKFRMREHYHSLNEAILYLLRDKGYDIDGGRNK